MKSLALNRIYVIIGMFVASLFLSSCFEFTETITLNKNGSGHYKYHLDAREFHESMMSVVASASQDSSESKVNLMQSFDSTNRSQLHLLSTLNGISKITCDTSNKAVYIIEFDFINIAALNEAIKTCFNIKTSGNIYSFKKKNLSRNTEAVCAKIDFNDEETINEETAAYFQSAKYNMVINLPKKVKSDGNDSAFFKGKQVVFSSSVEHLYNKSNKLSLQIKY